MSGIKRNADGFYVVEGRPLISVTTALSIVDTGIGDWKARVGGKEAGKISRAATTLGTKLHSYIENDFKGEALKVTPAIKQCVGAYHRWKDECAQQLLSSEEFVYSMTHRYAGTIDAVGADAVYDFKTSKRISPLYWLQLAAYAFAYMQMRGTNHIKRLVVVRLDKEFGDYYQEERQYSEDLLLSFLACLRVWRYYNQTEKENDDDEDQRIIASLDIEPNRTGNSSKGTDKEVGGSEDSDDRSGEMWQV